jgi:prophage regulatory protein
MRQNAKEILKNGYFDASDELENAVLLESIASNSICDSVAIKDAAIDIRYLVGLVQDLAKMNNYIVSPALLKIQDVQKLTQLSDSSIYRLAGLGKFPRPIKLSNRASAFVKEDIEQWIEEKIKEARS